MAISPPQTFNDGVCHIYEVVNIADVGNLPVDGLRVKTGPLRYGERKVGITRFWAAAQANARVDAVIRVLRRYDVSTQDICIPRDGQQYRIKQVQHPSDITPQVTDLTLERIEQAYKLAPLTR